MGAAEALGGQMDETAKVEVGGGARGRIALIGLTGLLAAALAVPLLTDSGNDDALQPLGLRFGSGTAGLAEADAMLYPAVRHEYVLRGDLPNLGSEATVYRVVVEQLDASSAQRLATAFGVNGTATPMEEGFEVSDGERLFSAWPSPAGWYVSVGESYDRIPDAVEGSAGGGSDGEVRVPEPTCTPDADERVVSCIDVPPGDDIQCITDPCPGIDPTSCSEIVNEDGTVEQVCALEGDAVAVPDEAQLPPEFCSRIEHDDGTIEEMCTGSVGGDDLPVTDGDPLPVPPPDSYRPEPPADLPSADEAEQIARDVLERAGVLDGDWHVEALDGGVMSMGYAQSCNPNGVCTETDLVEEEYVMSRMVTFTRVLGGHRVDGLQWSVDIGDEGVVTSVWGTHADVEPVADYPLRPIDAAYADMVAGEDVLWGGGMMPMLESADAISSVAVSSDQVEPAMAGTVTTFECPDTGNCVLPNTDPFACKPQPEGTELCLTEPYPGDDGGGIDPGVPGCKVQPDGSEICEYPDDVLIDPMPFEPPFEEPEPIVIEITGAELGLAVIPGTDEDGREVTYVVPTYEFVGEFPDGGGEYRHPVLALAPEWIGGEQVTTTTVLPTESTLPPISPTIDPPPSIPTTSIIDEPTTTSPETTVVPPDGSTSDTTVVTGPAPHPPGVIFE